MHSSKVPSKLGILLTHFTDKECKAHKDNANSSALYTPVSRFTWDKDLGVLLFRGKLSMKVPETRIKFNELNKENISFLSKTWILSF